MVVDGDSATAVYNALCKYEYTKIIGVSKKIEKSVRAQQTSKISVKFEKDAGGAWKCVRTEMVVQETVDDAIANKKFALS